MAEKDGSQAVSGGAGYKPERAEIQVSPGVAGPFEADR